MNCRWIPVLIALLPLWWGPVLAQTGELEGYMSRGRELSKAGKIEQALPYFSLALELAEARFGTDDPALVPMIDDLAGAQAARENYRDAEPLYERALMIQEQEAARYQTGIVRTLNNLGGIYEATDRASEALALYRRVITLWAPVLGGDHPDVRVAGGRLAKLALRVPNAAVAQPDTGAQTRPRDSPPVAPPAKTEPEPKAAQAPPKPVPKPEVAQAKPPAEPPPEAGGGTPAPPPGEAGAEAGFSVHLTSVRNPRDAPGEWDRLRRLYGALLGDLELRVTRADLGPKRGIYYRVKGGMLAREAARARCAAFAARGVWCDVSGPEGTGAPPVLAAPDKTPDKAPDKVVVAKPPPAAEAAPKPASRYRIHLTSIRDPRDAEGEWRRLRRLYGKLLKDLSLTVVRADLGPAKGVYYRVQGGNLTRRDARALCARFSARKIWCRVVPPGDEAAESSVRLALQRGKRVPPWRHGGTRRRHLSKIACIHRRDRGCRRSPFTGRAI